MKKAIGIGCSDWDIIQIKRINGSFMDFLRDASIDSDK
jgi:hypothetical protein